MTVQGRPPAALLTRVLGNQPCQRCLPQTDLATVRDAMEATDEALARKEQEAAYMVDGEM